MLANPNFSHAAILLLTYTFDAGFSPTSTAASPGRIPAAASAASRRSAPHKSHRESRFRSGSVPPEETPMRPKTPLLRHINIRKLFHDSETIAEGGLL